MILSVSRRTDIPAFYSEWFYNRIRDGWVLVRNPMNPHQVSRISITPELVDCIVFWTKNPAPMLSRLDELEDYNYYFQFTLNAYGKDMEPRVPSKCRNVCDTFIALSDRIGSERMIWRYDPIIVNETYTAEYHVKYFGELARRLDGRFCKCVISFVDLYKKSAAIFSENRICNTADDDICYIAQRFSEIARIYGFEISTCAEQIDLSEYGISHGKCVDGSLIEKLTGHKLAVFKD